MENKLHTRAHTLTRHMHAHAGHTHIYIYGRCLERLAPTLRAADAALPVATGQDFVVARVAVAWLQALAVCVGLPLRPLLLPPGEGVVAAQPVGELDGLVSVDGLERRRAVLPLIGRDGLGADKGQEESGDERDDRDVEPSQDGRDRLLLDEAVAARLRLVLPRKEAALLRLVVKGLLL